MNKVFTFCCIATSAAVTLLFSACNRHTTPAAMAPPVNNGYRLVWAEEFNYNGLPDTTRWGYETGYIRNNEKHYYTFRRPENASVQNGVLTITGRKEDYKGAGYTAASLHTRDKAFWKYGRIEIRAKLPPAVGTWPALWLLGTDYLAGSDWPECGEIDIMEAVAKDPNKIFATIHYGKTAERHKSKGTHIKDSTVYNAFHVYGMEWTPDSIQISKDNTPYFTFTKIDIAAGEAWAFDKPFYLIINLALGGGWGGGDSRYPPFGIDDSRFPQKFEVDYVRVYQK